MRCSRHPDIETNLRCGKCETPICPRCMVQTPVGARCRACARLSRLPVFSVSGTHYLRAVATGIGMAAACGAVWAFAIMLLSGILPLYLGWLAGPAAGYATGEVIGLSVNRKRSRGLAVIGGSAIVLAYAIALLVPWGLRFSFLDLIAIGLGVFVAISRLR